VNWTELRNLAKLYSLELLCLFFHSGMLMCITEIGILIKQRIDLHVIFLMKWRELCLLIKKRANKVNYRSAKMYMFFAAL